MAESPHIYPYAETGTTRLGHSVLRPFVPLSLAMGRSSTSLLKGLVDTGADAVLASDLLAEDLGVDLSSV